MANKRIRKETESNSYRFEKGTNERIKNVLPKNENITAFVNKAVIERIEKFEMFINIEHGGLKND